MEPWHSPSRAFNTVIADQMSQGCRFSSSRVARLSGDLFKQLHRKCWQTAKESQDNSVSKKCIHLSVCLGRVCVCVRLTEGQSLFNCWFVVHNGMRAFKGKAQVKHYVHHYSDLPHCSRLGIVNGIQEPLRWSVPSGT